MGTRSVPRQADERRTAAEKGMHVAGASGRGAGTVPAVTSDATQSRLLRLVLSEAGRLLIIGLILGLAGMAAMTEVFAPVLYRVSPTDPAIMLIVVGVIVVALMLAAWLPAWRASRIAAAEALRQE